MSPSDKCASYGLAELAVFPCKRYLLKFDRNNTSITELKCVWYGSDREQRKKEINLVGELEKF